MKALLRIGNKYVKKSSWRDFAMGLIAGTYVAEKSKKTVRTTAAAVFAITYFPLMFKLFKIAADK